MLFFLLVFLLVEVGFADLLSPQITRKVFDDAINGPDVEENEKGEVAFHGITYGYWTTKIPAEGKNDVFAVSRPGAEE